MYSPHSSYLAVSPSPSAAHHRPAPLSATASAASPLSADRDPANDTVESRIAYIQTRLKSLDRSLHSLSSLPSLLSSSIHQCHTDIDSICDDWIRKIEEKRRRWKGETEGVQRKTEEQVDALIDEAYIAREELLSYENTLQLSTSSHLLSSPLHLSATTSLLHGAQWVRTQTALDAFERAYEEYEGVESVRFSLGNNADAQQLQAILDKPHWLNHPSGSSSSSDHAHHHHHGAFSTAGQSPVIKQRYQSINHLGASYFPQKGISSSSHSDSSGTGRSHKAQRFLGLKPNQLTILQQYLAGSEPPRHTSSSSSSSSPPPAPLSLEKSRLLYRASLDGWTSRDFYRCCCDKGSSLLFLIKTRGEGYVFGAYIAVNIPKVMHNMGVNGSPLSSFRGYTDSYSSSSHAYSASSPSSSSYSSSSSSASSSSSSTPTIFNVADPSGKSFLFSLVNEYACPFRLSLTDPSSTLCISTAQNTSGLSFGCLKRNPPSRGRVGDIIQLPVFMLWYKGNRANEEQGGWCNRLDGEKAFQFTREDAEWVGKKQQQEGEEEEAKQQSQHHNHPHHSAPSPPHAHAPHPHHPTFTFSSHSHKQSTAAAAGGGFPVGFSFDQSTIAGKYYTKGNESFAAEEIEVYALG